MQRSLVLFHQVILLHQHNLTVTKGNLTWRFDWCLSLAVLAVPTLVPSIGEGTLQGDRPLFGSLVDTSVSVPSSLTLAG